MGIFKSLFKSKPPPEDPTYEIIERNLSIDSQRYQVRVKKEGREFFAEDLFKAAKTPKDLSFSRLLLLNETPPQLHFAPTLPEAVDWFRGRKAPKDGYNTIWWGDQAIYQCNLCEAKRTVPLRITKLERLTVATLFPTPREIVGWRVVEVESELTGKGMPTKKLDGFKTIPTLKWEQFPNKYLCTNCAQKLTDTGRPPEEVEYFCFEAE